MSETPFEGGEISLTIKHNGKYEDPWVVFRGTPAKLKSLLAEFYGLGVEEEQTVNDVFLEAVKQANAEYNAVVQAGGTVIKRSGGSKSSPPWKQDAPAAEEASSTEEAVSPEEAIIAAIAKIDSVDDLKKLWAENRDLVNSETVLPVWKARGKELAAK